MIGRIHARIHAKPNDIAGRAANLKVRPTMDVGLSGSSVNRLPIREVITQRHKELKKDTLRYIFVPCVLFY